MIKGGNKIIYPELSYEIMNALFEVHSELGNRYQEKYYQRAVAIAFAKRKLKYNKELAVNLLFQDKSIGKYFLDFLVEDKIIVELKTVAEISYSDIRQVWAYLKAKNLHLGILANFRSKSLTYKRLVNADFKNSI
jgi:GxxExxY protein